MMEPVVWRLGARSVWPLAESDQDCLAEAMLLAYALVGSEPQHLNARVLFGLATEPQGLGQTSVHVVNVGTGGARLHEWIEVLADGSARRHRSAPPDAAAWPTVEVDHRRTPARDRLAGLAERAGRLDDTDRSAAAALEFLHNALSVTAPGAVAPIRRMLRSLIHGGQVATLITRSPDQAAAIRGQAAQLTQRLRISRERGQADGRTAAEVLIAIELARAIANGTGLADGPANWIQYLGFACLRVGERPANLGPVIGRAVQDGFADLIGELARAMLDRGVGYQSRALDLDPPNRIRFAKILYDGYPYVLAARILAANLVELLSPAAHSPWTVHFHAADALAGRFVDGMLEQWIDLGDLRLRREREQIAAALADGDRRTVQELLVAGENTLRRPRSARSFLLGEPDRSDESEAGCTPGRFV